MSISYEGIGHSSVTFPAGTCTVGYPCKMGTDGKVANCAAGDKFCGVAEVIGNGWAGVQIHGFVTLPYTGTAPAKGFVTLVGNGSGGVKTDASGRAHLVVAVDATAATVTFEL